MTSLNNNSEDSCTVAEVILLHYLDLPRCSKQVLGALIVRVEYRQQWKSIVMMVMMTRTTVVMAVAMMLCKLH